MVGPQADTSTGQDEVVLHATTSDPPGRMEAVGVPVPTEAALAPTAGLSFVGQTGTGETVGILVHVARFWHAHIPHQYLELRHDLTTRAVSISLRGLEHPWKQADVARLLRSGPKVQRLIQGGGRPRRTPSGLDHEAWQRQTRAMRDLRRRGVAPAAIGKRLGLDARTVKRWLRWLEEEETPTD